MNVPTAKTRPEILAPAGDETSLRAAIAAGADAVYFGLSGFNARARAKNFDGAALAETFKMLHEHGVKGYVALNTLVFDDELESAEAAVRACADAGADAVIVQDLGMAQLVKTIAPDMPIHASTQMTCTDASSVEFAREMGASRVILARELSVSDIAKIRSETDMELEVFVHGALCIAYSGQCLTSEAIGGRSANRGACAQACRLPYELLVDGEVRDLGDKAYLLSPEDLEASSLVPELTQLGVTSFKIEGRLKGPEYVAATTKLYRTALSDAAQLSSRKADALQMYTRGSGPGFLQGVNHQRLVEGKSCDHRGSSLGNCVGTARFSGKECLRIKLTADLARGDGLLVEGGFAGAGELGGRVWTLATDGKDVERAAAGKEVLVWLGPDRALHRDVTGKRVWKTDSPSVEKRVLSEIETDPHRVPIAVSVRGKVGEPAEIAARTPLGVHASVRTDLPIGAGGDPGKVINVLRDKLGRLGETPFVLQTLETDLPSGAVISPSSMNRARRALVEGLLSASRLHHATTSSGVQNALAKAVPPSVPPPSPGLFVLCRTLDQALAAVDAGATGVYLDFLELTGTGNAVRTLRARGGVHITLAPPRIRKPGEEKIDKYLLDLNPDALLVRSLGTLRDGKGCGVPRVGDFSLNVTNRLSAAQVLARDLTAFTPSFDLDAGQLSRLLSSEFGPFAEVVIHHPMPLFYMEHCVIAALLSSGKDFRDCGRPCDRHAVSLRDRAGMVHPVEADVGCRNTVFHAAAQSAAGVVGSLQKVGVGRFRIELVREKPADVLHIVKTYQRLLFGEIAPIEVYKQLNTEGGVGVVRGTLRVLNA